MQIAKLIILVVAMQFWVAVRMYMLTWRTQLEQQRARAAHMLMQQLLTNSERYFLRRQRQRRGPRKLWAKTRSNDWWERIVLNHFEVDDWLENFRVGPDTFRFLCTRLKPYLEADERSIIRKPITVEKKVAIALYKLASCAEYRVVANQFGTHKSIVHKCLYAFCKAVYIEFQNEYLVMPNSFEASEVAKGFEDMCGLPNVVGVIDGTHIPILPPKDGYRDFVNRKGWPSYNILAIVDHLYRFRYATCQHPGSAHDSAVLNDSALYKNTTEYIPNIPIEVDGDMVQSYILGDPAYPLLPWLIKGYKGNISIEEESFNVYLNRGRVVVENAFGRLKARFRCLLKRIDIDYKFVPDVVVTCLILHNMVEMRKERFQQQWLEAVRDAEIQFPQPGRTTTRQFDNLGGGILRDKLKSYMRKFPILTTRLM